MRIFRKSSKDNSEASKKRFRESLRNILGFYPKNISLYELAFRHSSVAKEISKGVKNSNERLEYLGDSVIGSIISDFLFKKFPYKDEGFLTKVRAKLVSRRMHNQLSLSLGLDKFVSLNDQKLAKRPTSINGDAYEAFIGAIYLDKGYKVAQQFVLSKVLNIHIDIDEVIEKEVDFKSKIIEWAQKEKKEFKFITEKNDNNLFETSLLIDNKQISTAENISKKRTEQMVAEQACEILKL